jgi:dTDP-4-dehydrorhamnose reductase
MRILITGISGRIGFEFARYFLERKYEVAGTFLSNEVKLKGAKVYKIDLSEEKDTVDLIKKTAPDIVLHTAASTDLDLCETDHKLADRLNVDSTSNVVRGSEQVGAKVVLVSTSNVFDGKKKSFSESDPMNPINYYGKTKMRAEQIVGGSDLESLILRIDQPYYWIQPWQKDNSVTRVLKKLNAGEMCTSFTDWYNTPIFQPDLNNAAFELLRLRKTGIYNIAGPDFINRYQWALITARVFNKDAKLIKAIKSDTLDLSAKRANANMDNSKVEKELGIKFAGVEEGLKLMSKIRSEF